MLFEGGEFGVVHRHQAGQPHPRLVLAGQIEALRGGGDCLGGGAAGLQRLEIEHRLDLDEAAQLARVRRFAGSQRAPGEMRGTTSQRILDHVGRHRHRRGQRIEPVSAVGDAHQADRQGVEAASEARIGRQGADQRRRLVHPAGNARQLLGRQEQQAVLGEELAALRLIDGAEMRRVGRQCRGEPAAGLLRQLRGRGIDHSQHIALGKRAHELVGALRPGQLGREQLLDVGGDREMPRCVDGAQAGQRGAQRDHRPGMTGTQLDEANDRRSQHGFAPGRQKAGGAGRRCCAAVKPWRIEFGSARR